MAKKKSATGPVKEQATSKQTGSTEVQARPIRFALLWHQHQPYYRAGTQFILPWVWLHATKDYLEMAQHLERQPAMRATINLVPSLLRQLEDYLSGESTDPFIDVLSKPVAEFTDSDKQYVLENFFHANPQTMIFRSERYRELYDRRQEAKATFSEQDLRDLIIHYALAWTGEFAREQEPFASLIKKERDFSELDKDALFNASRELVKRVIPLHRELMERGQVELTTSPFYHPILPLLVDHKAALDATPGMTLPKRNYLEPTHAEQQLLRAREYHETHFGKPPAGVWPSEGSVSPQAVGIIASKGFRWTATDEAILERSLASQTELAIRVEDAKYFPWKFEAPTGPIAMFFRDHSLSDNIGFTYQSWKAVDAAANLIERVKSIRTGLIERYGEVALETACVSVILDGENCWEYYPENGREFLQALYTGLVDESTIEPVTFSTAVEEIGIGRMKELTHLASGSWINADFRIWIGHPEDNVAWDMLSCAKRVVEDFRNSIGKRHGAAKEDAMRRLALAEEELMIAEGSDWCWWYGDDHYSAQKDRFDELYRMHLRAIYVHLDQRVPLELGHPVYEHPAISVYEAQGWQPKVNHSEIAVEREGIELVSKTQFGSMHRTERVKLESLRVLATGGILQFNTILQTPVKAPTLVFSFTYPLEVVVAVTPEGVSIRRKGNTGKLAVEVEWNGELTLRLPLSLFEGDAYPESPIEVAPVDPGPSDGESDGMTDGTKGLEFTLEVRSADETILARFPEQDVYRVQLPQS